MAHDTGVLAATTAFGKTVVACKLIAERNTNTLILVHRQQLLDQWVARLRATMTGGGPVMLHTNMEAGHGGAAGRFDSLKDTALAYAFALQAVGAGWPEARAEV